MIQRAMAASATVLLAAGSAMAGVITTDSIHAFSSQLSNFNRYASYVVNDSFDDNAGNNPDTSANGHTQYPGGTMWLSLTTDTDPHLVIKLVSNDADPAPVVASMHVWNYNELGGTPPWTTRGVKDVEILSSETLGGEWVSRGSFVFAQAPGTGGYMGEGFDFAAPFAARYIKLDINSNHGDPDEYGLSEIQFSTTPIPEPMGLGLALAAGLTMLRRRRA